MLHRNQEGNNPAISKFDLCKGCHCQSCFHQHLDKKRKPISGKHTGHMNNVRSNNDATPTTHLVKDTLATNWSEKWFQDIARFRKNNFWACHSDRAQLH